MKLYSVYFSSDAWQLHTVEAIEKTRTYKLLCRTLNGAFGHRTFVDKTTAQSGARAGSYGGYVGTTPEIAIAGARASLEREIVGVHKRLEVLTLSLRKLDEISVKDESESANE